MSAAKRPSTSSLRRFISSRPYVPVAELRRRFGLDEPDTMVRISRNGTTAFIGVPAREAAKLEELWARDELGVELSVDVHAPVVVGVFPMRIARFVVDQGAISGPSEVPDQGPNGRADAGIDPGAPVVALADTFEGI
jgi:hypothetical protein